MHAIVHVGMSKAGSTAIQMGLGANRENLRAQGVLVGPLDRQLSGAIIDGWDPVLQNPKLRLRFGTLEGLRSKSEEHWAAFAERLTEVRPDVVLMSSEHLLRISEEARIQGALISRLRPLFARISVVCYVRDPLDRYVSGLNQKIRAGTRFDSLPLPGDNKRPRVATALRAYRALLGADDVAVRNFARSNLQDGDVVADFFARAARLAGRPIPLEAAPEPANESLCGAAAAWMMTLNETYDRQGAIAPEAHARRQALIGRLRTGEGMAALPRLKLTDPALIAPIREVTRQENQWLNETVLQGQVPLETAGAGAEPLPPEALRARLRDWLLGYLTPEAVPVVARAALCEDRPAQGAKARGKKAGAGKKPRGAAPKQTPGTGTTAAQKRTRAARTGTPEDGT